MLLWPRDDCVVVLDADGDTCVVVRECATTGERAECEAMPRSAAERRGYWPRKGAPALAQRIEGLVGALRLPGGLYVAAVRECAVAAALAPDCEAWRVRSLLVLPLARTVARGALASADARAAEARRVALLHKFAAQGSLHFLRGPRPAWLPAAGAALCWNHAALERLAGEGGARCALRLFDGFAGAAGNANHSSGRLALVSRRSSRRQGTRFLRRGLDAGGAAANFVETTLCVLSNSKDVAGGGALTQVRGSLPVFWAQPATAARYTPPVAVEREPEPGELAAVRAHFARLAAHYGGPVTAVNLIDDRGDQRLLRIALVQRLAATAVPELERLVQFDFHAECRGLDWSALDRDLAAGVRDCQGATPARLDARGRVLRAQAGVLRVNCMDNLDRTNVAQAALAWDALRPPEAARPAFRRLWTENADALSRLYAGTGALKTDFTRLGRRTVAGMLQDARRSVHRWWRNRFRDGSRQDAVSLWADGGAVADAALARTGPVHSGLLHGIAASAAAQCGPCHRLRRALWRRRARNWARDGPRVVFADYPLAVTLLLVDTCAGVLAGLVRGGCEGWGVVSPSLSA